MADTEQLQPEKHAGGRPSKYTADAPERIVQYGKQGMCMAEMACEFDVTRETLYEWARVHPEFSDSLERAQEASESYWAGEIRKGLQKTPSEFQGAANLKYMAQRFKGWSEKAHVDTRSVDPADEAETPDLRGEARRAAFLLSKATIEQD
tara:strand:+ start:136 stop:585 length:450 start_codon:yes stop_codon:yes gene_type:complete